jgi:hypothetical protein
LVEQCGTTVTIRNDPQRGFVDPHQEIVMSRKRHLDPASGTAPCAAPVRWLVQADVTLVQRSIADIAPEWTVELHGLCAEEATLVLLPEGGDDAMGPSFLISQDGTGYLVDQVHWDLVSEIGIFPSLAAAMAAVCACLGLYIAGDAPRPYTLH